MITEPVLKVNVDHTPRSVNGRTGSSRLFSILLLILRAGLKREYTTTSRYRIAPDNGLTQKTFAECRNVGRVIVAATTLKKKRVDNRETG